MDELNLIYEITLDKLKYKFDSLLKEFSLLEENNPIEHVKYRIKKLDSIEKKLIKKNKEFTAENIRSLNDIVGVRIVCCFLSDMYTLIDWIKKDSEIRILNCKNYIDKPKKNGYMSYHLNIEVPINFQGKVEYVKAEIQVRTIAMDMWASLEHKIWYKKGITLPEEMMAEIHEAAVICNKMDESLNTLAQHSSFRNKKEKVDYPFIHEDGYKVYKMKYELALLCVKQRIEAVINEYDYSNLVNPIEHIKGRIKSDDSIGMKLKRYTDSSSIAAIDKYISDVAGIRIVCSFRSEMEKIISFIRHNLGMEVLLEKDYVANPKESGYRAHHFLVNVPLYLRGGVEYVKVEIQLRTIAMDMWASLEHKLCYQKDVNVNLKQELKNASEVISIIDKTMDEIIDKSREMVMDKKKLSRVKKKN